MQFNDYTNFHQMLCETIDQHADSSAYQWFDENGAATSITWQEFYSEVKLISKSLIAQGLAHGDKNIILSSTCYKWILTDVAGMSVGCATVGIYQSNLANDCKYIINHSDAILIFAEDQTQLNKLLEIRDEIPNIRRVVLFNGDYDDDWVIPFEEFILLGKTIDDAVFDARVNSVKSEDTAGLIYTSGTTGTPKGVVLSHDNITFICESCCHSIDVFNEKEMFLFLPLAHVFARTGSYVAIRAGNRTSFSRGMDTLLDDFGLAAPDWFFSVPRVFEKIHSKIISSAEEKGGIALKVFNWATELGAKVSTLRKNHQPISILLAIKYNIAVKLIFGKIHKALGGHVKWCISGGAPLSPEIARFFHAAGLLIIEGYGMTENTSVSNANRLDSYDFGVVGPPAVGVEHKIAEDGEILIKGRNVMKEYYKMPEETTETFTRDGWLKTGDWGAIDEHNVLKITGRKKDLIITAGGKNIAPFRVESIMLTSKYINQFCVVGDKFKYLTAVVTLDQENTIAYAEKKGIGYGSFAELLAHPDIQTLIENEVAERNKTLPSFETVKKIVLAPEFTIENKMMTPTFKLKKNVILEYYNNHIQALYS